MKMLLISILLDVDLNRYLDFYRCHFGLIFKMSNEKSFLFMKIQRKNNRRTTEFNTWNTWMDEEVKSSSSREYLCYWLGVRKGSKKYNSLCWLVTYRNCLVDHQWSTWWTERSTKMQKITSFGKNDFYSLLTLCSVKRRWASINLKSSLVFFFDWLSGFSLFEFVDHTLNFLHMWF